MELWLALIKVILIVLFIIVGLIYDWGGVVHHPGPVSTHILCAHQPDNLTRVMQGLANFRNGQAFSGFSELAQTFAYAFFSYGGVELVALTAGEASAPHRTVPRAVRTTFIRIVLFYVLTVLVVGLCINRNDPTLLSAAYDSDVAASPVTIVFVRAGFGAAAHVVNAVLLTAVLSATNACFYASSRTLMSLARAGQAPTIFGRVTKRGVPVPALW
jgi:amino acid permease